MSKFERKISRSGLGDYEKVEIKSVKENRFKEYLKLDWLTLTPQNALFMFGIYIVMAILVEPLLAPYLGVQMATVCTHGVFTSFIIVLFLNGKNGTKAGLVELLVRYLVMAVIFGLGTMVTSTLLFK